MSSLSIFQQTCIRDAVGLLTRAMVCTEYALDSDAVDELEDAEQISSCQKQIAKTIEKLNSLIE